MLIEMDITFSFLYSTLLSYWANKCFSSLWNSNKYIKFKKIIKMAFQPGSRGGRGGMFAIKCFFFFFFCSYPSSLLCFQVREWSDQKGLVGRMLTISDGTCRLLCTIQRKDSKRRFACSLEFTAFLMFNFSSFVQWVVVDNRTTLWEGTAKCVI